MADVRKFNIVEEAVSSGKVKTRQEQTFPTGIASVDEIPEIPFMGIVDVDPNDEEFYFINASRVTIYISVDKVDLGDSLPKVRQAGTNPDNPIYFYVFNPGDVLVVGKEEYEKVYNTFLGQIASGFVRVYGKKSYSKIKSSLALELAELTLPVYEIAYEPGTTRPAPMNPAIASINKRLEELSNATLKIDETIKRQLEELKEVSNSLFII